MPDADRHHLRSRAAHRRGPRAHHRAAADRRPGARHEGRSASARPVIGAGRQGDARPRAERDRRAGGRDGSGQRQEALSDSPPGADVRRAVHRARRCSRPASRSSICSSRTCGRQDRPVRRRRRRQDRRHHGADQQHRHEARRRVGVRRRRRAHPRRQRPLARNAGVGRYRSDGLHEIQSGADLRPDDRAARSASARRPDRPDRRRILPRRRRPGRAALHRQHLPLHAGRFGSVGAAGPHAVRRRIPAEPGDRDGRAAGAHHLDQEGFDHLGAGHLRARRRLHRSGAGDDVRAPRCHHEPVARHRRAGHLSGGRSAGVHLAHSRSAASSARSTTTSPSR